MEDGRSGRLRKDLPLPGKTLITALDENLKSSEQSPAGAAGHGFPWAPEGGARAARGGARAWHGLKLTFLLLSRLEQCPPGADREGKVRDKRSGSFCCWRLPPRSKPGGLGDH